MEARIKVLERELNISTVDAIADRLRDVRRARANIAQVRPLDNRGVYAVAKWLLVILFFVSPAFAQEPSDLYLRTAYCFGAYQQMKSYLPPAVLQSRYGKDIDQKIQHLQEYLNTRSSTNSTAGFSMANKRGRDDEAVCYECASRVTNTTCPSYSSDPSKARACMIAQCTPVCAVAKQKCDKLKDELPF